MNGPQVGELFTRADAMPWTLADGTKGTHQFTLLVEVVGRTETAVEYEVREVRDESGCPPGFGRTPQRGTALACVWSERYAAAEVTA